MVKVRKRYKGGQQKQKKEKKKDVIGEKKKKKKKKKRQRRQRLSVKNPKNSLFICVPGLPARLLILAGIDRN